MVRRELHRVGRATLGALEVDGRRQDHEPVVLLHGIPAGAELWRGVLSELGDAGRSATAVDLPGYGRTAVAPGIDHSLPGAAELIAAWLRQRDTAPVWLVGHDLGGVVAQLLAVRHPDLVGRLTLGDCPVGGDTWPVPPIRLLRALAIAGLYDLPVVTRLASAAVAGPLLRGAFADPSRLDRATLRRVFLDGKVTDGAERRAFARHLRALDPRQVAAIEHELADIRVPTQLIWGAEDPYLPFQTVGVRLRDSLPEPVVTVLDDAGHFAPLERPQAYVEALLTGAA